MQSHALSRPIQWWRWGLWAILAVNLFGLHFLLVPEPMWVGQENHDTRVIYGAITSGERPVKWLTGDWPLHNSFYRPVPAYAYWVDVKVWGRALRMYKITNWVLCLATAFALVWCVWTIALDRGLAVFCGLLLSCWQTDFAPLLPLELAGFIGGATAIATGFFDRGKRHFWWCLGLALPYLFLELRAPPAAMDMWGYSFGYRSMGWPPGRTSLFLALFGIVCIAAYVTWERSRKARWAAVSLAAFLLSAMSYEQFVILAPCLLLTSVYLRWTGVRTRSWLLTPAFIITAAYVWWHLRYLPMNTRYQQEHARGALSIETDLLSWLFPASRDLHETRMILDPTFGLLALISAAFWICLLMAASNLNALRFAKSNWKLAAWSMAVSFVAFLPMAREKPLAHYLYFPGALRTVWIGVLLGGIVGVARRARGPRQEVAVVQVETRDVIAV